MDAVESMDPAELNGTDPMHIAMGAWATVHGLATLWLDGALALFTEEGLEALAMGIFEADTPKAAPS